MKRTLFIFVSLMFLLSSCQNSLQSSDNKNKTISSEELAQNKYYYIEFIHLDSTNQIMNSINQVKSELLNNGFIAKIENDNEWQGIRKIGINEEVSLDEINPYHPYIHRFRDFSYYDAKNGDIEKIEIIINKPIDSSIHNFNYHSYKKLGHKEWQSVFNPGNFRYAKSDSVFDEAAFIDWAMKTIVVLTFK